MMGAKKRDVNANRELKNMVTGNEFVFDNIEQALDYVLDSEKKSLANDQYRQSPPMVFRPMSSMGMFPSIDGNKPVPLDSLDYPLTAWFNTISDDKFVMTRLFSGRYSLKPNLCNRHYLFRGESEFHSPCKPNLFRNPKQHRFTGELAKGQEMMLLMLSHPLVQLLDIGVELDGKLCQFEMNLLGLTQHYYNKSSLLDLTSDPQVAAFFATTTYDWTSDTYSPILDSHHKPGVLYYYTLDINQDFGVHSDGRKSPLSTIGLQVFPRSGSQKGFLYTHSQNENFNDVPRLNAVRFRHDAIVAKRIFNRFNSGDNLFPDDILMKHWKRTNRDSVILSNRTAMLNRHFNPEMSILQVETELKALGYEILDYKPTFTDTELDEYYAIVQTTDLWQEFCNQIHIPGDVNGKMMEDLLNLPDNPKYCWAFKRDENHVTDYRLGYLMSQFRQCLL